MSKQITKFQSQHNKEPKNQIKILTNSNKRNTNLQKKIHYPDEKKKKTAKRHINGRIIT